MPENIAIPISVASGARVSTFSCIPMPIIINDMPHSMLSATSP